ncbi:MAG: leucine-rich repeat protein [Acutalibacteraceae bacterium]
MEKEKTLKRLLACIMVIIMALTAVPLSGFAGLEFGVKVCAEDLTEGYYTYTVENGEATITDCDSDISGDVTVPSALGGYSVTSIGNFALSDCSNLTSITIPDGVTSIGDYVLSDCSNLTSITIPDSVTSIGYRVFYGCGSLECITVKENNQNYTSKDGILFNKNQTSLIQYPIGNARTSITIPDSVTSIGNFALSDCINLTRITIPDSVMSIGNWAFSGCSSLASITIPDGVTSIAEGVFYRCSSLTSITIPDSVTSIGNFALSDCSNLTSITIPDSVTSIVGGALYNTAWYNNQPDCLVYAGKVAYEYKGDMPENTQIVLEEGTKSISDKAFLGCGNLTSITIPDSVTSIGNNAFEYCSSLTSITIPDGVTSIGNRVFYGCRSLTSITIPDSVTSIGDLAFYDCSKLKDVYYVGSETQWEAISIGYNNECLTNATIHTHTHSYTSKVTKAATCTADGVTTYTCTCGDSYTEAIPATGKHTYKTTTTKATTSKDGKAVTACTVCKAVSKTVVIPKVSSITLSATKYTYSGKTITPTVTVKDSKGKVLTKGTDYTVTYASGRKSTGKYTVTITLKGNYSGTKTLNFYILPSKTAKLTATQTTTAIKATWKAVTGASGYKVVIYKGSKAVKSVYTTKTSYTFSNLSKGTTYKVRVTAYKTIDGKKVLSSVYTDLTTATKPGTPTLKVTAGSKKAALSWNKQTGATGYVVYMSTSKNGTYKKVATVKGSSKVTYTKTGLTKGSTYYFKVRAYKTVDGKNIYGSYSSAKSVKVK